MSRRAISESSSLAELLQSYDRIENIITGILSRDEVIGRLYDHSG